MIFRNFVKEFMKIHAAQNSPQERRNKRSILDNHLLPYFGDMWLSEIDAEAVDGFTAEMLSKISPGTGKPLAKTSVNQVIKLLSTLLSKAETWGKVRNPPQVKQIRARRAAGRITSPKETGRAEP